MSTASVPCLCSLPLSLPLSQLLLDKRVGLKRYEVDGRKVFFYFDEVRGAPHTAVTPKQTPPHYSLQRSGQPIRGLLCGPNGGFAPPPPCPTPRLFCTPRPVLREEGCRGELTEQEGESGRRREERRGRRGEERRRGRGREGGEEREERKERRREEERIERRREERIERRRG